MREITILEKIYKNKRAAKASLQRMLKDILEMDIVIPSISPSERNWVKITLDGPDEEAAARYLEERFGALTEITELQEGEVRRGKIIDLGKVGYGLYVDVGVTREGDFVDALVPVFSLRRALQAGRGFSVRRISRHLGLLENLPLEVRITSVEGEKGEIAAELTHEQARWLVRKTNRFYVCGETRRRIKNALSETGNSGRVVRIRRLGLLESEVQCMPGINPYSIIRQVGPLLDAAISVPRGLELTARRERRQDRSPGRKD